MAAAVHLPAMAHEYRVAVPRDAARVTWSGGGLGWDVEVTYDPEACVVYCTYRRSRDLPGKLPLLPPAVTIRIGEGPMEPRVVVVDPAGVASPGFAGDETPPRVDASTGGKRLSLHTTAGHVVRWAIAPPVTLQSRAEWRAAPIFPLRI